MIVSFFTRNGAGKKKNLYVRLTKEGKSTEIKLDFVHENSGRIDVYKNQVSKELIKLHNEQLLKNKPADVKSIKMLYLGQSKVHYLSEVFLDYINSKVKPRVANQEITISTQFKFTRCYNHLKDFMQCRHMDDINICAVDREFIDGFENHLRQFNAHNAAMKNLSYLKQVLRYACDIKGYISKNPFNTMSLTPIRHRPVFLGDMELLRIMNRRDLIERLEMTRDVFVFQCFTGLSYSDIHQIKAENISEDHILIYRKKTKEPELVYLYDVAKWIMRKYNNKLPIYCNQRMNAYLKEIATLCNISKKLTTHVARHTFATTITLNNGVPIEAVRSLLGHSRIEMTEHYAQYNYKSVLERCSQNNKVLSNKFKVHDLSMFSLLCP